MNTSIEVIPLGGVGEFGMNCMALRYQDEMIVIDAGMGFPGESAYGVDIAIPDFSYLEQYAGDLTALILTHGHEDHLGALPYFLKRFNVPVYASPYTLGLAEARLDEHGLLNDVLLHRVEPRDTVELGFFEIEFIRVTHSLIDCLALAIKTPVGTIIHTGDYKIDETPVIGEATDLKTLRAYGKAGVLALLSDSTNATVQGRTPSERAVIPGFEEVFGNSPARVFVAAFASSVHRIQIVMDTAQAFGRRVCVLGRSMLKNVEIAERLGYLDIPEGLLIGVNDSKKLDRDEIVYLVTGSQGEPRAALAQLANGVYKGLSIERDDTVVLSARIIPGNEGAISKLEGDIYKSGAQIIDSERRLIHVSGHASQEDIKIMTEAVSPRYLIPIHGEYRMLYRHKEYARNHLGFTDARIALIENGDVLEISENGLHFASHFEAGRTFIDESGFGEIEAATVRTRKQIAFDGILTAVITIDSETTRLESVPEIITRGVNHIDEETNPSTIKELQRLAAEAVEAATVSERRDESVLKERVRLELKRYTKQLGVRPVIVPIIVAI